MKSIDNLREKHIHLNVNVDSQFYVATATNLYFFRNKSYSIIIISVEKAVLVRFTAFFSHCERDILQSSNKISSNNIFFDLW